MTAATAGLPTLFIDRSLGRRGDLPADDYVTRVLRNLDAIEWACQEPGPFIYVIHPARIERMTL